MLYLGRCRQVTGVGSSVSHVVDSTEQLILLLLNNFLSNDCPVVRGFISSQLLSGPAPNPALGWVFLVQLLSSGAPPAQCESA